MALVSVYPVQPHGLPPHAPPPSLHPYSWQPAPPPPPRSSPVLWVLAAMGLMAVLGGLLGTCGVAGLLALSAASGEEPAGVLVGAQVPQKTVDTLKARKLLRPEEALLAYHDATLRLDMSDVTFVTKSRVVHVRNETASSVALADVSKITHRTEALGLDVVDLVTKDGKSLRIEIAPLNGGEAYVDVIEDAWRIHFSEASVTRLSPRPAAAAPPGAAPR